MEKIKIHNVGEILCEKMQFDGTSGNSKPADCTLYEKGGIEKSEALDGFELEHFHLKNIDDIEYNMGWKHGLDIFFASPVECEKDGKTLTCMPEIDTQE
jgi:hypothetical protein